MQSLLTRRSFLKSASLAAGALGPLNRLRAEPQSATAPRLRRLDYTAVTLLPGPMQQQFEYHQQLLLGLDNDAMLKPFRERTGLAAPGEDLGGWYSNSPFFDPHGAFEGFVPGHSLGQWISALSRGAAITGNAAQRQKVDLLLTGLAPTLTSRFYDGYTLPGYTFDKVLCGLVDALAYGQSKQAAAMLPVALAAALPHLPEKALSRPEQHVRPHRNDAETWDETYTLPENLFLAFQRTGRPEFRDAAVRFLEDDLYFNPLAENINVLPGEHAYSHVNAFSSAMQAYLTLGSQKHLHAATNGFRMLQEQSFATGGWGPGETLLRPGTDDLARSLFTQSASFETPCGAYGHFKIARYLLTVTGDPRFGDSIERVLYNTVLGAKPLLPDGTSFYYSDYSMSGHKNYARDKWPCCSGTLPQIAADYGISSYFAGVAGTGGGPAQAAGMSVNLYVPSRVTWQHAGSPVTLTQQTSYPAAVETTLLFALERDAEFPLALRIPAWAGPKTRVLINGKADIAAVEPGTWHTLRRTWRNGDRVEIEFDMPLRTEVLTVAAVRTASAPPQPSAPLAQEAPSATTAAVAVPAGNTRLAALLRGPVVFMASGIWPVEVEEAALLQADVATAGDHVTVHHSTGVATHKPYTAIGEETYRTYQPLRRT
ncbi:beta-L-arabinofuranosidase domain-containing protein [Terriglobus sp.]|uniref:beta-L-arabinofuranosidase domain-containing protein n=1 Tax=Terriglobus sp. TaxID=1889013 RepID=UPI003B003C96